MCRSISNYVTHTHTHTQRERETVGELCGHGVAGSVAVDMFAGAGVKTVGANTPVAAQGIGPTPQHTANQQHRHYQQSTHLHTHIGGRWRKLVQQLENVFFDFEKKH